MEKMKTQRKIKGLTLLKWGIALYASYLATQGQYLAFFVAVPSFIVITVFQGKLRASKLSLESKTREDSPR
jgi:hypothetical protein